MDKAKQSIIAGAVGLGVTVAAIWALRRRESHTGLGLARLTAKKADRGHVSPSCPLLKVEDPAARKTEFWDRAFVDVAECPVRGMDVAALPPHVKPFADFMVQQAKKRLDPRDIAKAYLLTVSSVQRGAISSKKVREAWPQAPFKEKKVRPEDVMGALLQTPAGRRYLDAASRGEFDREAATKLRNRFVAFGLANRFDDQLKIAPDLARSADQIRKHLRKDSADKWAKYVDRSIPYIGAAKAGFFSALLGRGDLPTADAKEIEFWLCRTGEWDRSKMRCKVPAKQVIQPPPSSVINEIRDKLRDRLREMNVAMPAKYRPHYQHLVHHAVWDKIGQSKTTHRQMINAMERA